MDAVQAQLATNHHENRARTNAKSKSQLAGLIYDDAAIGSSPAMRPKTASATDINVTPEANGRSVATASGPKLRLPAAVVDELLRAKLQSFLTDKAQISLLLREARCRLRRLAAALGSQASLRIR